MKDQITNPIGILLTNLGTPDAPTPSSVKTYLEEFLWDPYVVQISRPLWWLLLNLIILKVRPKKSAKFYKKIWTEEGSPLLVFMTKLLSKLQIVTNNCQYPLKFALGMRYGKPSIKDALIELHHEQVKQIVIFPLYPQFSTTTTASTINHVNQQLKRLNWNPQINIVDNYATDTNYISALADTIKNHWKQHSPGQKLLFSFHGIPKKNISKGDPYFDQCLATANQVVALLGLANDSWEIIFQSRFGRNEWLQPYAVDRLKQLPNEGFRHIDIICPGFAVDCLETLEETAMTNKKIFLESGGIAYHYIPALNDADIHIQCLKNILFKHAKESIKEFF